jgi:hypothetical protein
MLSARAHGGETMDWTALVGGERIAAGLQPFAGRVSAERANERSEGGARAGRGWERIQRGEGARRKDERNGSMGRKKEGRNGGRGCMFKKGIEAGDDDWTWA